MMSSFCLRASSLIALEVRRRKIEPLMQSLTWLFSLVMCSITMEISSDLCFQKSGLLYFFRLRFIIIAVRNCRVKLESSLPSFLNTLKIIGMMPKLIICCLGPLENDNLCRIPTIGLKHLLSYLSVLNNPTKFQMSFFDLFRYCSPTTSVVTASISFTKNLYELCYTLALFMSRRRIIAFARCNFPRVCRTDLLFRIRS